MKIPEAVAYGPYVYKVRDVDIGDRKQDLAGSAKPFHREVRVELDAHPQVQREILVHELVHVVLS